MSTDVHSTDADAPDERAARALAMQASPEFAELRRTIRRFIFPMTAAFLTWYLLYVVLSAYARGFMDAKVVGNLNVAFFFGVLQFVSTFLIAWLYSRYAAKRFDPLAEKIKAELDAAAAGDAGAAK
ncbi:DUF485 domain-containing protein [Cryptosporangium aurantiacum]|uniref:Uncharacterized membrane protein, DUF485 family n=1 Tax=Cryptosporangium aurantiacum TaxID=134849 RepID=A0A1M7RKW2_9ACTN|nr:DUF485 domain-containing protein [Cryptosporangium aurantiacum]SHN46781.1 Uncharacterized membrane protein, DUF485 family [Cryptosporangium aurantiacum]